MTTRILKVAAAQYPLDQMAGFQAWTSKVSRWVADGAATGACLLVFPEYGAIEMAGAAGPTVLADIKLTLAAVVEVQHEASTVWSDLAARHRVHILAPSGPERRGSAYVNAARLYAPGGSVGVQDKLVMTPFERAWGITPGTTQRVFETALGRIGIAICYDSEFPLLVRAMTEAGADLILVPACTEHETGYHRVRNACLARALESQVATVMSSTVGTSTWSAAVDHNTGAAGIFVPPDIALSTNGVLAQGTLDAPGWVTATIDFARLSQLRTSGEMRNHADWSRQAAAAPLSAAVEVEKLA